MDRQQRPQRGGNGFADELREARPPDRGSGKAGRGKKRDSGSATVYILDGGSLKPVPVQVGITDNRNSEIVGGELKAGDRVAVGDLNNTAKSNSSVGMRLF